MKTLISLVIVSLSLGTAYSQSFQFKPLGAPADTRPITGEEWRLKLVGRLLTLHSPVINGAYQLYGMGDEVAVDILKILSTRPPFSADETQSALDIVHMAFDHPESILSPVNTKPQASLFLLQHLASTNTDGSAKDRITQEAARLRALAAPKQ